MQLLTDPVLLIVVHRVCSIHKLGVLLRIWTVQVKCLSLVVADRVGASVERGMIVVTEG